MLSAKEEFIQIYRANITRPGAEELLDYLEHKSDFFTAPSSAPVSYTHLTLPTRSAV